VRTKTADYCIGWRVAQLGCLIICSGRSSGQVKESESQMPKALRVATILFFVAFFAGLALRPAGAQTGIDAILAQVDACDILAASPDDPLRVAPGVPDDELVPRLAEMACAQALEHSQDIARHAFQLGRAKLELGKIDEALALFERAASEGSAIAHLFIGDAYHFGWKGSADPNAAKSSYETARNMGLVLADIALDQLLFDPDIFTTGPMLVVLLEGDIATAVSFAQNDLARAYLYAFALELSQACGSFLLPSAVSALQAYRFPAGWSEASEQGNSELGLQDVKATYDVEVMVDRHGCNGFVVENIALAFNDMLIALSERR